MGAAWGREVSDLETKLAPAESSSGDKARASLDHINKRWGTQPKLDPKKPPQLVQVRQADGSIEHWRNTGQGDGKDTVFEQMSVTPVKGKGE